MGPARCIFVSLIESMTSIALVRGAGRLLHRSARHGASPLRLAHSIQSQLHVRSISTHVSVIGLHWKTDETRLQEAFSVYGKLEEAQLVTPTHSSTHLWAMLVYSSFDEAFEAVTEMNGQELDGRLLRVSIVDPEQEGDVNNSLDDDNEQF